MPGHAIADLDGEDPESIAAQKRLDILREYRDGAIDDFSEPWRFTDTGSACQIFHAFPGGTLTFGYAHDWSNPKIVILARRPGPNGELRARMSIPGLPEPLEITVTGMMPELKAINFNISLDDAQSIVLGSTTIKVGDRVWPLHRRTTRIVGVFSQSQFAEVTGDSAAKEILDALIERKKIVISTTRMADAKPKTLERPIIGASRARYETRTT